MSKRQEQHVLFLTANVAIVLNFELVRESVRWGAVCQEFAASATGKTRSEARNNLQNTINGFFSGLHKDGILEDFLNSNGIPLHKKSGTLNRPIVPQRLAMRYMESQLLTT